MTPILITVKNGKSRPKNPYDEYCPSEKFEDFESTVEWHDCPDTPDGDHMGELIWQQSDEDGDGNRIWVPVTTDECSDTRKIWRIVPQPQEIEFCDTCDFPIKPKYEGDKYICRCKTGYPKLQPTDTNVTQSDQKEEAKTVEGDTAEDILVNMIDIMPCSLPILSLAYIIEAMQAYSSKQNNALMEENARLREVLKELLSHAPSIDDLGGDETAFMNSFGTAIANAEKALTPKQ